MDRAQSAEVTNELARILESEPFKRSERQSKLLSVIVDRALRGKADEIKELTLAMAVFGRQPRSFDAQRDPIVRVEAARLRKNLAHYYAGPGADSRIRIAVPKGHYRPIFYEPHAYTPTGRGKRLEGLAWYVMRLRTIEGYRKALELFSRATNEFPDLASAYRGIGWARICTAGFDGVPPEAGEQREPLRAAIEAAAALEPEHPEVAALKGAYAARYDHDIRSAERMYRDAQRLSPASIVIRSSFAWLYVLTGRFDEAQQLFDAAHTEDPFGFWHRHNLGSLAYYRRDYATAEKILREALEIEPDHAMLRLLLARVLMHSGRGADAITETEWCVRALPGMTGAELFHVTALASAGKRHAAIASMRDFERGSERRYTSHVYRAMAHAAIDEADRALEWLSRAVIERDYWLLNIAVEPAFNRLRPHAEFDAILCAIGLPDSNFIHNALHQA